MASISNVEIEGVLLSQMTSSELIERIKQLSEEIEAYKRWRQDVD